MSLIHRLFRTGAQEEPVCPIHKVAKISILEPGTCPKCNLEHEKDLADIRRKLSGVHEQ